KSEHLNKRLLPLFPLLPPLSPFLPKSNRQHQLVHHTTSHRYINHRHAPPALPTSTSIHLSPLKSPSFNDPSLAGHKVHCNCSSLPFLCVSCPVTAQLFCPKDL